MRHAEQGLRPAPFEPNPSEAAAAPATAAVKKFGMFMGVFTPSVLTILGAVMYLRFGWVVGNLGLPLTLLTVCLASSITAITALGASAIATNMRVGVGGEYFMISRSLGLELGGAIGIPLFLCRTLSITLYCFALAEAVMPGAPQTMLQLLAAGFVIVVTLIAGKSADLSLKLQLPIMLAVGLSLAALAAGAALGPLRAVEMAPSFRTAEHSSYWYVFAVFFPAVTGFTAGIGMSGDLKDPQRVIPRGTMLAVLVGWLVYMIVPVLLSISARAPLSEIAAEGLSWSRIALFGSLLILPGMWGAILSSAFGSALGGPRVLQALAADGILPGFLKKVTRTGQPMVATLATGLLATLAVLLGSLNTVAEWVTIFFLTLYVMINLSAAVERLVGDPSYRPTIRVPWQLSLLGAAGAIGVMLLIKWWVCIAAVILETVLWTLLRRRSLQKRWGDVRAGFWLAVARFALLRLRDTKPDARNFRPHIMLFAGNLERRVELVRLASWFNQDRGVLTVCDVVVGRGGDGAMLAVPDAELLDQRRSAMSETLVQRGIQAFAEVDVVDSFETGLVDIIQANGIAGLQSNTIMLGLSGYAERLAGHLRILRSAGALGKSMIIARFSGARSYARVDVWWGGLQNNGDLMLLLAYLLRLNDAWRGAEIVLRSIVTDESRRRATQDSLDKLIADTRIAARAEVILAPADRTTVEVMHEVSDGADLVFMGLAEPRAGSEMDYARRLYELAEGFENVVFVRNGSPFSGQLV